MILFKSIGVERIEHKYKARVFNLFIYFKN